MISQSQLIGSSRRSGETLTVHFPAITPGAPAWRTPLRSDRRPSARSSQTASPRTSDLNMRDTQMRARQERSRKSWMAAAIGTAVVALCCFTPLLVIVLGLVGLSFLTPYLDYVLLPALVVLLVITVVSY